MSRRLQSPLPPFDLVPPAVIRAAKHLFGPDQRGEDAGHPPGPGRADPCPA